MPESPAVPASVHGWQDRRASPATRLARWCPHSVHQAGELFEEQLGAGAVAEKVRDRAEFSVGVRVGAGEVLRPLRFLVRDGLLFDGLLTPHQGAAASEFGWCPVFPDARRCGFKSGRCRPSSAGSGSEDAGPHSGSNDGPYRPACVIASGGMPGQPFSFRRVTGALNDAADATLHAAVSRAGGSRGKGGSPANRFATASR